MELDTFRGQERPVCTRAGAGFSIMIGGSDAKGRYPTDITSPKDLYGGGAGRVQLTGRSQPVRGDSREPFGREVNLGVFEGDFHA